jgi:hypothetical protein
MFVRTLVTAAEPRAMSSTDDRWNPKATSPAPTSYPRGRPLLYACGPVAQADLRKQRRKQKTKPPGTSGSLAFPCKRADHLEVSCSERYPRLWPPSNGSEKFTFHWMWTVLWKRCASLVATLWTEVTIG